MQQTNSREEGGKGMGEGRTEGEGGEEGGWEERMERRESSSYDNYLTVVGG